MNGDGGGGDGGYVKNFYKFCNQLNKALQEYKLCF